VEWPQKLFPSSPNYPNVFESFASDDINNTFVSISMPDESIPLQQLPVMAAAFRNQQQKFFDFQIAHDNDLITEEIKE
jgi:hypothetical protein